MEEDLLIRRLVDKSIDSFLLAIEVINRPMLLYRSESFAFNICNAWEMLLKAELVTKSDISAIYEKGSKSRTIPLNKCVETVFTDFNNPVKKNLLVIIKFRNKATHFITPEYDGLYTPFFQTNVFYFIEHIKEVFNINLNDRLSKQFLTIAMDPIAISDIKALRKYDKETFRSFLHEKKELLRSSNEPGMTASFEVRLKNVKKGEDLTFKFDKNSDMSAQVIDRLLDPSASHKHRQKDIIEIINLEFGKATLNQYSFRAIREHERLEDSDEFYYFHKPSGSKTYSDKTLNLLRKNIKDSPDYIAQCLEEFKKSNPRS